MTSRGALFDLDGTLVNSLPDIAGCLNQIRRAEGLAPLAEPVVRGFVGEGAEHLVSHALKELLPGRSVGELAAEYRARYLKDPHHGGALYPGVRETLEKLRAEGFALGIVTNKPTAAAQATLDFYLPSFAWEVVAGPETVSARKPSPRHLLEVLARLRLRPGEARFVGDDPVDAACAAGAGVPFLGARYGFGAARLPPGPGLDSFPEILLHLGG